MDYDIDSKHEDEEGQVKFKLFFQTTMESMGASGSSKDKHSQGLQLHKCMREMMKCNNIHKAFVDNADLEGESQDHFFDDKFDAINARRDLASHSEKKQQRRNGQLNLNLNSTGLGSHHNDNFRDVPPEYANDPDLYFAIQASLGESQTDQGLTGWD